MKTINLNSKLTKAVLTCPASNFPKCTYKVSRNVNRSEKKS